MVAPQRAHMKKNVGCIASIDYGASSYVVAARTSSARASSVLALGVVNPNPIVTLPSSLNPNLNPDPDLSVSLTLTLTLTVVRRRRACVGSLLGKWASSWTTLKFRATR